MKVVCRSHRSQNFVDRCNDPIQKWVRWISKECSWPLNLLLVKQIKHFICHLHPYTMSNTLVPLYPSYYTNKGREMEDSNTSLFLDVHHVQKLRLAAQVASLILQQPQNCHLSLHHHRCSLQTTLKELSTQELPQLAHQTHDKIRRIQASLRFGASQLQHKKWTMLRSYMEEWRGCCEDPQKHDIEEKEKDGDESA